MTDHVPFARGWLDTAEIDAVRRTVLSGVIGAGGRVAAFEQAFGEAVGADHAVAVQSCTAGLHLCLAVLDIGPGDEVVVPSLSFIATANSVRYLGATPVFADVDPLTQNLTPETVEAVLTPATRAVMLVHQAGVPADLDAMRALCEPRGVTVVEDAACAAGATYRGRLVSGNDGIAAYSFHPRKTLTTGEGGMVTTGRADWAERLRALRDRVDCRMTDLQAALGVVQIGKLDRIVARRRELGARYQHLLAGLPGLYTIADPPHGRTNFQSFWIVLPDDFPVGRTELMARLMDRGVATRRGVMAAHLEPAYAGTPHAPLPVTERLAERSIVLPMFHELTEAQQDQVVAGVNECAGLVDSSSKRGLHA